MKKLLLMVLIIICLYPRLAVAAKTIVVAANDSSPASKASADYICDGVNDQVEIQAAFNSLPSDGGTVQLTEGTFNCTATIYPTTNSTLAGQGDANTFLNFKNGEITVRKENVTLKNFYANGSQYNYSWEGLIFINVGHVKLQNITATADNTTQAVFSLYGADAYYNKTIEDVEFVNCKAINPGTFGFIVSAPGPTKTLIRDVRFTDCQAINCGRYSQFNPWVTGFDLIENGNIENLTVTNCLAEGSWESGFHVESSPEKKNVRLINCTSNDNNWKEKSGWAAAHGTSSYWGAGFLVSKDMHLENCTSENNKYGYDSYLGGSELINCKDTGSYMGIVTSDISDPSGLNITSCDFNNETYPVFFLSSNGTSPTSIAIDGTVVNGTNSPGNGYGVFVQSSIPNANGILMKNSIIQGSYQYGIYNQAPQGKVKVQNVTVIGATTNFFGCISIFNIFGKLVDKDNNSLQANLNIFNLGTKIINSSINTANDGTYSLSILPGIYDIQYNINNFFIPNYSIKLNSINIMNDTHDLIKQITAYLSENKVSFTLNIIDNQTIETYSPEKPKRVLINGTELIEANSLSDFKQNTWHYDSNGKKLYISYGTVKYSDIIVPPDGYCYQSAFVSYTNHSAFNTSVARDSINNFTAMVGKKLFAYNNAAGLCWNESLWMVQPGNYNYKSLIDEGIIKALFITLEPYVRTNPNDTQTLKDIANGLSDDYIRLIANQAKNFSYPIFLKIGVEFNINQGNGRPSWGSNPSDFINAWRRIVDIFREEGASNVIFVWNPNCGDMGPHHWTEYYPGDEYVDWVGIDLYQFQQTTDPGTLFGVYNDYYAKKPIAICEWGVNWYGSDGKSLNYTDQSRANFINGFFDNVEARPDIKLISYQYGGVFMFNSSTLPLTTSAYKNRISNSRYLIDIS